MAENTKIQKNEETHFPWNGDVLVGYESSHAQGVHGEGIQTTFIIQREFDLNPQWHIAPELNVSIIVEDGSSLNKSAFYKSRDEISRTLSIGTSFAYDMVPKYFRLSAALDFGSSFQDASFIGVNLHNGFVDSVEPSRVAYTISPRVGALSKDLAHIGPLHLGLGVYWQTIYSIPTGQSKEKYFPNLNHSLLLGIHVGG